MAKLFGFASESMQNGLIKPQIVRVQGSVWTTVPKDLTAQILECPV